MKDFKRLIEDAESLVEKTIVVDFDTAPVYAQAAIAYALIAIAQELHQINEGQKLEPITSEVLSKDSPWSISPGEDSTAK